LAEARQNSEFGAMRPSTRFVRLVPHVKVMAGVTMVVDAIRSRGATHPLSNDDIGSVFHETEAHTLTTWARRFFVNDSPRREGTASVPRAAARL